MKKIVALLLVLVLALGTLSACQISKKDPDESSSSTTEENIVATVGDEVITEGEVKYAVGYVKDQVTMGMDEQTLEDFWNTLIDGVEPVDYIRKEAVTVMEEIALLAQAANEAGISVTQKEIDDYFVQNKDMTEAIMEAYGVSEDALKAFYRKTQLQEMYLATDERFNPTEEQLKEYFQNNYYKAQHILKMTVDSMTYEPLSQEEQDTARAEIDNILLSLKDGADFETLMLEQTQDPGVEQYPDGYVFKDGEMQPEFYDATVALAENEVSEVVETMFGYHIIKRLPLDMVLDYESYKAQVQQEYTFPLLTQLVEELRGRIEVTIDEAKVKEIAVEK